MNPQEEAQAASELDFYGAAALARQAASDQEKGGASGGGGTHVSGPSPAARVALQALAHVIFRVCPAQRTGERGIFTPSLAMIQSLFLMSLSLLTSPPCDGPVFSHRPPPGRMQVDERSVIKGRRAGAACCSAPKPGGDGAADRVLPLSTTAADAAACPSC